jgi:hypothetical protein
VPSKTLILDPLTLKGRELLSCSDRLDGIVGEWDYRHTALDDEHQIADLSSGPALVPPLENAEEFDGADVVVVASDGWSSRHDHLLDYLDDHPETALLDLGNFSQLRERTSPSIGEVGDNRLLRVAHPALFATSRVAEVLSHLSSLRGSLAVVEPVSSFGREAVEILARQAAKRLQGIDVDELIHGQILAFNTVVVDNDELQEDAAQLLPDLPLATTRTLTGCFHGQLAHLALSFKNRLEPDVIRDALEQAEGLVIESTPLSLDSVPDRDEVVITPPWLSPDGSQLAMMMMADGLRVGGALTAVEILRSLL